MLTFAVSEVPNEKPPLMMPLLLMQRLKCTICARYNVKRTHYIKYSKLYTPARYFAENEHSTTLWRCDSTSRISATGDDTGSTSDTVESMVYYLHIVCDYELEGQGIVVVRLLG